MRKIAVFAMLSLFAATWALAADPFNFVGEVEAVRVTWGAPDSNASPETYAQVEVKISGIAVVCDQRISEQCAEVVVGDHVSVSASIIPCQQCLRLGLGQNLVLAHTIAPAAE
jgi:hypothetical protein